MTSRVSTVLMLALMCAVAWSCNDPASASAATKVPKPAKDVAPTSQPSDKTAVFAGGCFWASEEAFDQVKGVKDSVSGYAGGTAETANYDLYHDSNDAEVAQVTYDPSQISYGTLLQALFSFIDPTQLDAQGPDRGHGYRSAIFYSTPEEKEVAEAYIKQLNDAKIFSKPIVTTVEPLEKFYPAEDYHQNYMKDANHLQQPYVANVSVHKVEKLREAFKGHLKGEK